MRSWWELLATRDRSYTRVMKFTPFARVALVLLFAAILAACTQVDQPPRPTFPEEILAVHITSRGVITADGREVTLEELKQELTRLAARGGGVLYTRDNPTADPHPNAMKVLRAVVDSGVRLLMPGK